MSELEKKRGVFIVELEGEGISSRAFVRKGKIIAESKTTSTGIELKFLNETGKQITDLCAWLEGRKLAVNESLIIPFGKKTETHEVLVMKDLFYEKVPVRVPAEEYNMTIGYIFGSESFIVGHKGKIVLHPRLYLETEEEEIQVSLALLKDIKVKVAMPQNQLSASI